MRDFQGTEFVFVPEGLSPSLPAVCRTNKIKACLRKRFTSAFTRMTYDLDLHGSNCLSDHVGVAVWLTIRSVCLAESLGLRSRLMRKIEALKAEESGSGAPDEFLCPITRELMKDPVIAAGGTMLK